MIFLLQGTGQGRNLLAQIYLEEITKYIFTHSFVLYNYTVGSCHFEPLGETKNTLKC